MDKLLKMVALPAGVWAGFQPAMYGALFTVFTHYSALIDFLVLASCLVLTISIFKRIRSAVFFIALATLLFASVIDFFHHFQDSGTSGPLPYEWLNGFYLFGLPLVFISIFNYLQYSKNNEQRKTIST